MAVLRLDRFTIDPADTAQKLTRHAAVVAAAKGAFPRFIGVELVKIDDRTWADVWRWDSLANAQAAAVGGPSIPQAGAAIALTVGITVEWKAPS
jgi:hypothetical protein